MIVIEATSNSLKLVDSKRDFLQSPKSKVCLAKSWHNQRVDNNSKGVTVLYIMTPVLADHYVVDLSSDLSCKCKTPYSKLAITFAERWYSNLHETITFVWRVNYKSHNFITLHDWVITNFILISIIMTYHCPLLMNMNSCKL